MSSFADFYSGGGMAQSPLSFSMANINDQMGDTLLGSGLQRSQDSLMYSRGLQNLQNDYSAKGTVRGGQAGLAADQLGQDYAMGNAMNTYQTDNALANMSRNKLLAAYGVMF